MRKERDLMREERDFRMAAEAKLALLAEQGSSSASEAADIHALREQVASLSAKDETIKVLRASIKELKKEKVTWQAFLACNMQFNQGTVSGMVGAMTAADNAAGGSDDEGAPSGKT